MVTSGAVAFGKQKLTQELLMSLSMRETLSPLDHTREVSVCAYKCCQKLYINLAEFYEHIVKSINFYILHAQHIV